MHTKPEVVINLEIFVRSGTEGASGGGADILVAVAEEGDNGIHKTVLGAHVDQSTKLVHEAGPGYCATVLLCGKNGNRESDDDVGLKWLRTSPRAVKENNSAVSEAPFWISGC